MSDKNGTFAIKRGDTIPLIRATLNDQDGAIDLTAAETVTLRVKTDDEAVDLALACVIEDAPGGRVSYTWAAGDTGVVGRCNAEFEIDYGAGNIETVPNDTYFTILIVQDLG